MWIIIISLHVAMLRLLPGAFIRQTPQLGRQHQTPFYQTRDWDSSTPVPCFVTPGFKSAPHSHPAARRCELLHIARELGGFLQKKKTTAPRKGATNSCPIKHLSVGGRTVLARAPGLALMTQSLGPIFSSRGAEATSSHLPLRELGRKAVKSSFTCQAVITQPDRVKPHYSPLLQIPYNSILTTPAILKLGQSNLCLF